MKIRTDFVTNSSSVSYIIMMDLDILDGFLRMEESFQNDSEPVILAKAIRALMLEKGTLSYIEDHEVYTIDLTVSIKIHECCIALWLCSSRFVKIAEH